VEEQVSVGLRKELIRFLGLYSDANQFIAPDGAMSTAENVWLARPGLLQKRRGFTRWSGTLTFATNKLFPYDGGLLVHCGTDTLRFVNSAGTVTLLGTGFTVPDYNAIGWRTRGCIAGKNFYVNTLTDIWRISGSTSTPRKAGGLVATNLTLSLTGASGFLADGYSCAYRYTLGSTDSYGRDIIGPVSGRTSIKNATGGGTSKNVSVVINLPSTAIEGDFVRLFRSEQVVTGSTPSDDLKLVYEAQLKAADIAAGYVTVTDIVVDGLRGDFLYTSPNAGEGILASNEPPPFAADLCTHKNRVWYANTRRRAEYEFRLLAVGGTDGIQANDTLVISGASTVTLTAKAAGAGANEYNLETSGTTAYNIEQTALSIVAAINASTTTNSIVWARYVSGPNDVPGKILVFSRSPTNGQAYGISVGQGSKRDCFAPSMLPVSATFTLGRAGTTTVTATIASGNQCFKVGEQVTISGSVPTASFGAGNFTVTAVAATTFQYVDATNNNTTTLAGQVATIAVDDTGTFFQEQLENRIYYSKADKFEAVPILNFLDVGRQDAAIVAIASADDQLWVWKRDGVYRVVGDDETNFRVVDVDPTCICNARETVVKFRGSSCGLTNKGYMRATVSGLEPIGWQINKSLLEQMVGTPGTTLESLSFAVAYDAEDLLLVFFGDNRDITSSAISLCNRGYVYNGKAAEWTRWAWDSGNTAGNGKRCGAYDPISDLLYFGDSYNTAGSSTYLYKERKARTVLDYRDQRGDAATYSITSTIVPVIQTARAPGMEKLWQEIALLYNGTQPASLTMSESNEWTSASSHTVTSSGSGYETRVWPETQCSRGQVLIITLTHDTVSEAFDLAGIQVKYEVLGVATSR
jgi:hypothetical protein